MSYFPFLEKDHIANVLNSYQVPHQNNWKEHLNSDILEKYIEIKRNERQKIAQILPRYQIFPNSFNQYNTCTFQHDINRLQRIKNASNLKHAITNTKYSKNSKSQSREQMNFPTSMSHLVIGTKTSKNYQGNMNDQYEKKNTNLRQNVCNRTTGKQKQNKSIKSLTQTNISPSKNTHNLQLKKINKNTIQSDSQVSIQNFCRENIVKPKQHNSWTSNIYIHKNQTRKNDFQRLKSYEDLYKNVESTLTVQKQAVDKRQSEEYYDRQKSSIQFRNKSPQLDQTFKQVKKDPSYSQLSKNSTNQYSQSIKKSSNKEKGWFQPISNSQIERIRENYVKIQKKLHQKGKIQKKSLKKEKNQQQKQEDQILKYHGKKASEQQIIDEVKKNESQKQRTKEKVLNAEKGLNENIDRHKFSFTADINENIYERNDKDILLINQKGLKQSLKSANKTGQTDKSSSVEYDNKKTRVQKTDFIDSQGQKKIIQQNMCDYYGYFNSQEYERVKQQRDYLRMHFMQHLQKHHSHQFPYKHLNKP